MKKLLALVVTGMYFALSVMGKTYYVNNAVGSDDYDGLAAVYDGTHGPKFRIRSAVALTDNGDIVHVAAGTYGDDQGYVTKSETSGYTDCRVYISKTIELVGAGRGKTILLGKLGTAENKQGSGALPGIVISKWAHACRISGFTIRDCATSDSSYRDGAAVYRLASGTFDDLPWVFDCAVENCYSPYGAFAFVNVARTIVSDCQSVYSSAAAYASNFFHCIFERNGNGPSSSTGVREGPVLKNGTYVVNCTFARNGSATAPANDTPQYMWNCVVVESAYNKIRAANICNCVVQEGSSYLEATNAEENLVNRKFQLAAPIIGDYRPVSDLTIFGFSTPAGVPTAGKASWLDVIPEEFRLKDVYGAPVTPDAEGRICAGAVQTTMRPYTGMCSSTLTLDGATPQQPHSGRYEKFYAMFDVWPRILTIGCAREADKSSLYGYDFGAYNGGLRFPEENGAALVILEKGRFAEDPVVRLATQQLWVTKTGSDVTGDGSEGTPYLTIQRAVDQIQDDDAAYALVRVGPGDYADGGRGIGDDATVNRVSVWQEAAHVAIRSTEGAGRTIIRGTRDVTETGLGAGAVRCVRFKCERSQLQGFTLTDGAGPAGTTEGAGGTAFWGRSDSTVISDCVVSNCLGGHSIVGVCTMVRCQVRDNVLANSNMSVFFCRNNASCHAVNSTFIDNASGGLTISPTVYGVNCSFYESCGSSMALASAHGYLANCIVGKSYGTSANANKKKILGCVFDFAYAAGDGVNESGVNFVRKSPGFAAAAGRDLHLITDSPAFGNALNAWEADNGEWTEGELYAHYYRWIAKDMDGNEPFFVGGKPTIGAYFKPTRQAVSVRALKGVAVETSAASETVGFDEPLTVSARSTGRPVRGLTINGACQEGVMQWAIVPSAGDFTPVYDIRIGEPMTWYADAVDGDDAQDGWSEATARKTIKAALTYAEPGEKVVALPGVYDRESMDYGDTVNNVEMTLPARVVVPRGVTVESRDGAETTCIKGQFASGETRVGAGAMRCVVLCPQSCIRGFTLTGGATLNEENAANGQGGGVLAVQLSASSSAVTCDIEDCIISNNVARYYGGGGSNGNYRRCRIFENAVLEDAGAGGVNEPFTLHDCIIDRNVGKYGAAETHEVVNCTFGANNVKSDGSKAIPLQCDPGWAAWRVYNSLFLGGGNSYVRRAYNCAVATGFKLNSNQSADVIRENCLTGDVTTEDEYRPSLSSVAVDAANPVFRPENLPAIDALGGQRVYNNALDIGALEADWRPRYAGDVERAFVVEEASPELVETENHTVLIPEGARMVGCWLGRRNGRKFDYVFNFRVSEGGKATITVNGVATEYGEGIQTCHFTSPLARNDLMVVAERGSAELLASSRSSGLSFIIR